MWLPVEADKGNDMILSTMNDLPGYEITEVTLATRLRVSWWIPRYAS
jgi:hypothetical protein